MFFLEELKNTFEPVVSVVTSIGVRDAFDIVFVTFIIYEAIKLIRETRAFQLAKGLAVVGIIWLLVQIIDMRATSYIFSKVFSDVILLIIILFQPEIRHAVEHMGRGWGLSIFDHSTQEIKGDEIRNSIIEIAKSCQRMSDSKTGSIIIMENKTLLGDIVSTGKITDSKITHELIGNIFYPNTPLHDGAAIVRDGRLLAAGCVLPLTQNQDIPSDLGMRHRAAIGVTEQSDAVAIITSEETGIISICTKGNIERGFDEASLRERLLEVFDTDIESNKSQGLLSKIKSFLGGRKK